MALTLNPFRRYIDLKTNEGLKIFNSALHGFESPLAESAKINLVPQDFQKLSDHLNRLGNQFAFDYLFKRAATTRTIIPAIPAIAAIAAIPADPLAVPPILAQPRPKFQKLYRMETTATCLRITLWTTSTLL